MINVQLDHSNLCINLSYIDVSGCNVRWITFGVIVMIFAKKIFEMHMAKIVYNHKFGNWFRLIPHYEKIC